MLVFLCSDLCLPIKLIAALLLWNLFACQGHLPVQPTCLVFSKVCIIAPELCLLTRVIESSIHLWLAVTMDTITKYEDGRKLENIYLFKNINLL